MLWYKSLSDKTWASIETTFDVMKEEVMFPKPTNDRISDNQVSSPFIYIFQLSLIFQLTAKDGLVASKPPAPKIRRTLSGQDNVPGGGLKPDGRNNPLNLAQDNETGRANNNSALRQEI